MQGRNGAIVAVIILAVFVVMAVIVVWYTATFSTSSGAYSSFTANGRTYAITYDATTPQEWEHGLMNTTVTNSTFMLFVFGASGKYSFWMYDTDYNLDIMWLNVTNSTGRVVYIASNVTGCFVENECAVYTPSAYANYVLEAKGGFAARNNIGVGSEITLGH